MITLLYFLLVLNGILMAVRLLPLLFMISGAWWLYEAHRWALVLALILGAILGVWRSLSNRDEPAIHRGHRLLACRRGIVYAKGSGAAYSVREREQ